MTVDMDKPTLKTIDKINDPEQIKNAMSQVFQEAQLGLAGHRKLVVVLKNIQQRAILLGYEEGFILKFTKLLNKILPMKKGEESGDRIAKFCSVFISSLYKDETDDSFDDKDTPTSRFVDYLLRHLLRGIQAKDKNVRYRVVQLLAYLVNFIGEIDEELFKALHWSLNRRLYDKEPYVRIQAVVAVSRFQYIDIPDENEDEEEQELGINKATQNLLHALRNDESAEVRRAALLNIIKNETTLPFLIERGRDTNTINRRLVYSRILKEVGDFRHIETDLREDLINWGLNDREESVKASAFKVFNNSWLENVHKDLLDLIENLNLVDYNETNDLLIKSILNTNFDLVEKFEISKNTWKELTMEKSFLLKIIYQICNEKKLYNFIDEKFLDSIELSEILYKYLKLRNLKINENEELLAKYNTFKNMIEDLELNLSQIDFEKNVLINRTSTESPNFKLKFKNLDNDFDKLEALRYQEIENAKPIIEEYNEFKDDLKQLEFVIEQLLIICKEYDFSDEIGRRSMLQIVRSSLSSDNLTDKLIEIFLNVLKKLSINERDFSTMCTEIITDIRDSYMDENDETFHSAISGFMPNESDEEDSSSNSDEDENMNNNNQSSDYTNNINRIQNVFDNENFQENTSYVSTDQKRRKLEPKTPPDDILIQCLRITQHLLELVNDPLENNYALGSLIESLVKPAVLKSEKPYNRKLGMKCLGLFCLLDKRLAIQNLYILGMAASKGDEELRIICVKIIFDILSTFGLSVLDVEPEMELEETSRLVDSLSLAKLFYKLLRSNQMPELQAVIAEGLCKLFLADTLDGFGKKGDDEEDDDEEQEEETPSKKKSTTLNSKEDPEKQLFETLILTYFHPENQDNNSLRQTLAFCIPVYAFSHSKHQEKIAHISGDCFFRMFRINGELSDSDKTSSPTMVIQQLIHWCEPTNLVNHKDDKQQAPIWQALGFLQVIEQDTSKNVKRIVINNLNKLLISEAAGSEMLKGLVNAVEETIELIDEKKTMVEFNIDNLTLRNLNKFREGVAKVMEEAIRAEEENAEEVDEGVDEEVDEGVDEGVDEEVDEGVDEKDKEDSEKDHEEVDEEVENIEKDNHQQKSPQPPPPNLAEIDEFLDAEDNMDYDVTD